MADKALEGVRILDMTHVQSGPSCTQILGFLGADVVKLEPPGRGDITRGQLRDMPDVDSLYFTMLNCNKRSITLNLKNEQGKTIFTELLKTSDVVVENFGPGVLDRLGFPWETIQAVNPRAIYASIKGFGSYGPNKDFKAYEPNRPGHGRLDEHHRPGGRTAACARARRSATRAPASHMVAAILAASLPTHPQRQGPARRGGHAGTACST